MEGGEEGASAHSQAGACVWRAKRWPNWALSEALVRHEGGARKGGVSSERPPLGVGGGRGVGAELGQSRGEAQGVFSHCRFARLGRRRAPRAALCD